MILTLLDDDAPEEMGLSSTKQKSLSQQLRLKQQQRTSRDVEKEKRRNRNEMFRKQKVSFPLR